MINLNSYGWNDQLNQLKQQSTYKNLIHARVSTVHKTCYEVISENGMFQCELTGTLIYGRSDFELPCTGDWIIFQPFDGNKGIIVDILPRQRILYCKKAEQLLINRLLLRMSIKHLLCKVSTIISMSAEPSALWFSSRKKISIPYWYSIRPI